VRVLCLNAGSSSLKVSLVDPDDSVVAEQDVDAPGGHFDDAQLGAAVHAMEGVEAVGHRVVHSGPRYTGSVRIDADVIAYLLSVTDLAPLHMPAALAMIGATVAGRLTGDMMLTRDELDDLMRGILISHEPARGTTRLTEWLPANAGTLGRTYASEMERHYRRPATSSRAA